MKFGFPFISLHPGAWVEVAQAADEAGFESCWIADHLVFLVEMEGSLDDVDHPNVPPTVPVYDAPAHLSFLAGQSTRINLGVYVYLTEAEVEHRGEFYDFKPVAFESKPVQQPHPPVLVGGLSDAALRRAPRFQGWMGMGDTFESVRTAADLLPVPGWKCAKTPWGGRTMAFLRKQRLTRDCHGSRIRELSKTTAREEQARAGCGQAGPSPRQA